jgi:hypothetical protein
MFYRVQWLWFPTLGTQCHKNEIKDWIKTLAIEADTVINQLNINEQAYMIQSVTKKLQTLIENERNKKIVK